MLLSLKLRSAARFVFKGRTVPDRMRLRIAIQLRKSLQSCNYYTLLTDITDLISLMTHCFGNFANSEPIALLRRGLCVQSKNAVPFGYLRALLLGKLKTQLRTSKAEKAGLSSYSYVAALHSPLQNHLPLYFLLAHCNSYPLTQRILS